MSRIAVLVTDMFEDVEYKKPSDAYREAGHEVVVLTVGKRVGAKIKGKRGLTITADGLVSDFSVDDFDALFIPGGYSPDKLRVHGEAVEFTRDFVESGKPVFIICHGPQLLITARVLEGRRITGWKSIIQDIKNAGAEYLNKEVVTDDNLVSSRSPDDIPAFIRETLSRL